MGKITRKIKGALGMVEKIAIDADDADFIHDVRKKHAVASKAEATQRAKEKDDLRFCDPENQWPANIKSERLADDRPCLTEDQLGPFIDLVVNSQRQNRPATQINPVGDDSDPETAEIYQGMIRHIQNASNGDTARDTAYESMVRCGRGYYRILTDWESPESMNQVIKFQRIPNHFMVYFDPESTEPDGSDANWVILEEDFSEDRFREEFPDAKLSGADQGSWESIGDNYPGWIVDNGSTCRVVEIYWKEFKEITVCLCSDGKTITSDKLPEKVEPKPGAKVSDGVVIVKVRQSIKPTVKWAKLNAVEVLERKDWLGSWIPVLPVYGKELNIDGERSWAGLVRSAKDPQMRLNFMLTAQTETIALAPRAPWIGPLGFMGNRKEIWQTANRKSYGALEYDIVSSVDGKPLPPPSRDLSEPPIRAITEALQTAQMGLKGTTGMYNPQQGNAEQDISGIATKVLVNQGNLANFHFQDNLTRTIHHEGEILVELIPLVYDTERTIQIIREDGTHDTVTINGQGGPDPITGAIKKAYDVTSGKYGVTISAGPNYETKRQENLNTLMGLAKVLPMLGQLAPDLITSQMDIPIAKELTERLQLGLPPAVQQAQMAKQQGKPMDPQMVQVMAKAQQMGQMIQQLTAGLNAAQQKLASKDMEVQGKIQVALIQARAAIIAARERAEQQSQDSIMNAAFEEGLMHLDRQYDLISQSLSSQQNAQVQPPEGAGNPAGQPTASPAGVPAGQGAMQ